MVVHVLYANEQEKIPVEQVEKQIEALNSHFSLAEKIDNHPNDPDGIYAKRAVDTQIRFCLATQTEAGKPMEGIEYVATKVTQWEDLDEIKKNKDGANPANQNKYLNIWVAHLPDDNAGFAQMPNRRTNTDGIVIDYRYFGFTDHPKYGGAKTLSFLTAQFLSVYPLSGHSLDYPCSDDFVDDTPLHNSRNSGCPSSLHVSICTKQLVPEMLMNLMSANTSDNCKYMFTRGQAARMQAVLDSTGLRHNLTLSEPICVENNLAAATRNTNKQLDNLSKDTQLSIYPNPASHQITIEVNYINASSSTIEILTADGKLVLTKTLNTEGQNLQTTINTSNLNAGFYLVKVRTNQSSLVQKLTIE